MLIVKLMLTILIAGLPVVMEAQYSIDRIEPPSWWTGMRNQSLQVMVQGKRISELSVSLDYPGITITGLHYTSNPDYLFIDLDINPGTIPGVLSFRFNKGKELVTNFDYVLEARKPQSEYRKGFDHSDVVYLITPDRFSDGNPGNNAMDGYLEGPDRLDPDGRHGGDLRGIQNHLDYIADMGFTAIWLNPVLENNMARTSYHGYAITDFYKVDPRFGSNDEYRELVNEAKKKGIKVVMDMVFNHCGSNHWWMKNLPSDDWLNYAEEKKHSNHRRTTLRDPYASGSDKKLFSNGWFVDAMPDLNQRNPLMARYLLQNSIWWIEYSGISGIRVDTYSYPDKDFMSDWSCALMEEYPGFSIVGEEWSENPAVVSYWQKGKTNPDGYISCMKSMMDFPLHSNLIKAMTEPENSYSTGFVKLYEMLSNDFLYPEPSRLMLFPDNHDMNRFFSQVGEDLDLYKMGLIYVLTINRIPQIFYGTEILMTSPSERSDGRIRSDFPGGWKADTVNVFSGSGLSSVQLEAKAFLKKLLNWRKTSECILSGKLMHFAPEDGIYVYFRYLDQKAVMVILNKNKERRPIDISRFKEIIPGGGTGTEVISGKTISFDNFEIPARASLIIELHR